MFNKIRDRIKNPVRQEERGSALIFAIVLTIVTLSIVTLVVAVALTAVQKTSSVTKITYYEAAAQNAVAAALLEANTAGTSQLFENTLGVTNARYGEVDKAYSDQGLKWRWYTQRITNEYATSKYYIFATGYRESPDEPLARTLRITVDSVANARGVYDEGLGQITYTPGPDSIAQWGFLGATKVNLNNGALLRSYVSKTSKTPSGSTNVVSVGSNGPIYLGGSSTQVNRLNFLNYNPDLPNRCTGLASKCNATQQNKIGYATNLEAITTWVNSRCSSVATAYPVWRASENAGILSPGCYNTLIFDATTTLPAGYNSLNPAEIFVKGNIIVEPGAQVNVAGKDTLALRIYSEGGTTATFNQGATTASPTRFYGTVTSSTLTCTDGTTNTQSGTGNNRLQFYGSLVCDQINLGFGTTAWWDEMTAEFSRTRVLNPITGNYEWSNVVNRIWYISQTEETY